MALKHLMKDDPDPPTSFREAEISIAFLEGRVDKLLCNRRSSSAYVFDPFLREAYHSGWFHEHNR